MQITIDVEAKFIDAISKALAAIHGTDVSDEQVSKFIEMDLNARYEQVHDNIGFDEEVSMMLDEMEDYFI